MVCPVCHCLCDDDTAESWGIFVNNAAETFTILPCSVRDNLMQINGGFLNFKAHGRTYSLDVFRGHNTTVMGGDDRVKFTADYNLGHGGEGVVPEEEVLNDEHMEGGHPDIVCSRNVVLSEAEASRLDVVLTIKNGFIGPPFVQRLTETNVKSMKIPKKVAETLNMPSSGVVGICLGAGLCTKLAYKTDIDGRMVLSKGWGGVRLHPRTSFK